MSSSIFGNDDESGEDDDLSSTFGETSSVQDPALQQAMPPPPPRRPSSSVDGKPNKASKKSHTREEVDQKEPGPPPVQCVGNPHVKRVMELLVETNGKVFRSGEMAKLMSMTETFKCIAKARCVGSTTNKTTYFLTKGGYRNVANYGDAFKPIFRQIVEETREMLVSAIADHTPEPVRIAILSWSESSLNAAESIFIEAVQTYVTAFDDFDLNGRLMGGDDLIIDTSSGSVVLRECTRDDHVSYSVGYDIKTVLTNQKTAEYLAFKQKLERIIKVPGHRAYLMPLLAAVALNGNKAWLMKLIMAMCGPKDSAKSTLFLYVVKALGDDYSGNIDFNELTTGQSTGSCNDAAMRRYLDRKRFCLIDEGAEDDDDGTQSSGRSRKRLMHSRIKSLMSNTPKKARNAHSLQYSNVGKFPFIVITLNQSNMFPKPSNKDDRNRWLLVNADSLAKFKTGVVDDDVAHVYAKDADFVSDETINKNRIHMLSLLCEYYNSTFDEEASIPDDMLQVREEWNYRYDTEGEVGSSSTDLVPTAAPAPIYLVPPDRTQTPTEALNELVEKTCELLVATSGKLVTLMVNP
jgi:hypothetical protein